MKCPVCGKEAKATADADGKWKVTIEGLAAGGPFEMTVKGKNTITLENVLVGEVWVCSGQSNMAMRLGGCSNAKEEAAKASFPKIRFFRVKNVTAEKPLDSTEGQWVECSPTTVVGFSGVGYFFGRKLHQELGVPVGLINTSWGGSGCSTWYQPYVQAWTAAGIFPAFAAGNAGGCGTAASPGNKVEATNSRKVCTLTTARTPASARTAAAAKGKNLRIAGLTAGVKIPDSSRRRAVRRSTIKSFMV